LTYFAKTIYVMTYHALPDAVLTTDVRLWIWQWWRAP